ncbi:hypothetical protein BTR23_00405 [Alkalihalophilus pseudofirmus]|uniref:DUF2524 family protein n=1 Tax=Alkalihalobacterium alkalinitrilicum TaxID=427920 RepID=UPI00094CB63B|nr:DUF2524 family protein [Alkalihalobacterium alkalinitrilicum]OLO42514.1 hypothetical protein BTR23_00405 [Alkalihalophilus pseudofirmus]
MAIHQQVDFYLLKANEVIEQAQEQLNLGMQVQEGDAADYSNAQQQLEDILQEIDAISRSATAEQRDQLGRAQQRIRQMQNQMILQRSDF